MDNHAQEMTPDNASVEGLEEVFVSSIDPPRTSVEPRADQAWSLSDAAVSLNITERTVRRWIKEGRLAAWKVDGPRGPEWRINPRSTPDIEADQAGSILSTVQKSESVSAIVQDLTTKLEAANEKLTAASYRIGYLESQLHERQNEIKLLTDSQYRAGWWRRFCSWALGQPTVS